MRGTTATFAGASVAQPLRRRLASTALLEFGLESSRERQFPFSSHALTGVKVRLP